jgi:class 3 adenylate cyclase
MAPFGGLGGAAFRAAGFGRSTNPALCTKCTTELGKSGLTGVEIPCTLLFSDIRGSTALGERMRPKEFHDFLERFYKLATSIISDHEGIVDKVVGDEVIGLFFGGVSGPDMPAPASPRPSSWASDAPGHTPRQWDRSPSGRRSTRARPSSGPPAQRTSRSRTSPHWAMQ